MDSRPASHRVRLFLRDFRLLEAALGIADGQSLAALLSHRRTYMSVRDARWNGDPEVHRHLVIRVDQTLWASLPDEDVPVSAAAAAAAPRAVELSLEGGLVIRGGLSIGAGQRLSDYLETSAAFLPLHSARLMKRARGSADVNVNLGDIVVNQAAVLDARELANDSA
jgi:hypothetical protein